MSESGREPTAPALLFFRPEIMTRREFLGSVLVVTALVFGSGHAPYPQWAVYRRKHLLILTDKTDPPSYKLGKRVAEVLATHLPASEARVTRAPFTRRIASLISTKQMDVAILSRDNAAALMEGRAPFAEFSPVALRALAGLGDYLLVCRDDFRALHAYLVARTLAENRAEIGVAFTPARPGALDPDSRVPTHPGARAFYAGLPPPEKAPASGGDE
jgi:TRAP-type uncharacterized transport system substrate-binding protein